MAHLVCELFVRLGAIGRVQDSTIQLPITQSELGDTLGLSTVHVNRVLQELRKDGLIRTRGSELTVLDWERLQALAEFTPIYLSMQTERR